MAGLRNDSILLKTHITDISGVYSRPGYAQVYAMSGGLYLLNEDNIQSRLDNIPQDLSQYALQSDVAAISAGLDVRIVDLELVNGIQSTQIQDISSAFASYVVALSGLADVIITEPISGQSLQYNGTHWVNVSGGSSTVAALDDLTDVVLTLPVSGDFLAFDGTNWINRPLTLLQSGQVAASIGVSIYQINHSSVDPVESYPVVSLETPSTSSVLFVQSITERTSAGFKVVLSGEPLTNDYKINWIIGSNSTSVATISHEQIPLMFNVSSYPYFVDLAYVPIRYVPSTIVGNIKSWEIVSENGTVGDVQVDVWYNSSTLPTSADSIVGGNYPQLVSENQHKNITLPGWTSAVNNGYFAFKIRSITALNGFVLQLLLEKV